MKPKYRVEFVRSTRATKQKWFWRVTHRNGNQIARSSELYSRRLDCKNAFMRLFFACGDGHVAFPAR